MQLQRGAAVRRAPYGAPSMPGTVARSVLVRRSRPALAGQRTVRGALISAAGTAATIEEALKGPNVRHYIREQAPWPTDIPIAALDAAGADGGTPIVDLLIAGAGPSGLAVGARVAEAVSNSQRAGGRARRGARRRAAPRRAAPPRAARHPNARRAAACPPSPPKGYSVAIIDPQPLGIWPNNYGVWVDEFQAMGLEDCLEVVWPKAKVWLDNGEGEGLGEK
jgi:hypothetical protein